MSHSSNACCERPVAVSFDYTTKGSFKTVADTKCYITGPSDAKKAVLFVYDIFGFTHQSLQGADILSTHGKEKYLVVMPDLLNGGYANPAWFAKETEENQQAKQKFFSGLSNPAPAIQNIHEVVDAAKEKYSTLESWGAIGYCWGGKIVSLTSASGTLWSAAIQTSPAMVDAEDAKKISIPFGTLASKDESAEAVKAFHEAQQSPKILHIFEDQVHGWMSARAALNDEKVKQEYERGYHIVLEFFAQYL